MCIHLTLSESNILTWSVTPCYPWAWTLACTLPTSNFSPNQHRPSRHAPATERSLRNFGSFRQQPDSPLTSFYSLLKYVSRASAGPDHSIRNHICPTLLFPSPDFTFYIVHIYFAWLSCLLSISLPHRNRNSVQVVRIFVQYLIRRRHLINFLE